MNKTKRRLSIVAIIMILALAACGMSLFSFAADATTATVDENGFYEQVQRGGVFVDVNHEIDEDGFSVYSGTKSKDLIVYSEEISPADGNIALDVFANGPNPKSNIQIWLESDSTDILWKKVLLTREIGGGIGFPDTETLDWHNDAAVKAQYPNGITTNSAGSNHGNTTVGVGEVVRYVFNWEQNEIDYQVPNYILKHPAATNQSKLVNFGGDIANRPEKFTLKVLVNSNSVTSVGVRVYGKELVLKNVDFNRYPTTGYELHYTPQNGIQNPAVLTVSGSASDKVSGIWKRTNSDDTKVDLMAFAGTTIRFPIIVGTYDGLGFSKKNDTKEMPVVSVGSVHVMPFEKNNAWAGGFQESWSCQTTEWLYEYTIPADATNATIAIEEGDYTVTYKYNNETIATDYLKSGMSAIDSVKYEIAGKRITGWKQGETDYDFSQGVTADLELNAVTVDVATVRFMVDGQEYHYVNIDSGVKVTAPEAPTKDNYTFAGWYTESTFKNEFDFDTTVSQTTTLYAKFDNNVNFYVVGYNGTSQVNVLPKGDGEKITEDDMPSFSEITGWPQFANVKLEWYEDSKMSTKLDFGDDGIEITAPTNFYAAALDKDAQVAMTKYMTYDLENGWDRNGNGIFDGEEPGTGNSVNRNDAMRGQNDTQYGNYAYTFTANDDGSATFKLNYIGYIVNGQKLDVNKDIYVTYTLKDDSAVNNDEAKNADRYFMIGLFNSYASALSNQAQMHLNNYGVLAGLEYKFTQASNNNSLAVLNKAGTVNNNLTYEVTARETYPDQKQASEVTLIFRVGETDTKIYQAGDAETLIATLPNVTRDMFPNGAYLSMQVYREAIITAKVSQETTVAKDADDAYADTISFTVPQNAKAGDKIHFTIDAPQGRAFTTDGLFADGKQLTVREDTDGYFFNLPLNVKEITVRYGFKVVTMSGSTKVEELIAIEGQKLDRFALIQPTVPTGYKFGAWYTDAACTQAYDFDAPVTAAVTLYAKFNPDALTCTLRDGSTRIDTVNGFYDSAFAKPEDPTKEGYEFKGWYTDAEFTTEYDWSTVATENINVYAKFEAVAAEEGCGCGSSAAATSAIIASVLLLAAAGVIIMRRKACTK